jgi:hypothetical protein
VPSPINLRRRAIAGQVVGGVTLSPSLLSLSPSHGAHPWPLSVLGPPSLIARWSHHQKVPCFLPAGAAVDDLYLCFFSTASFFTAGSHQGEEASSFSFSRTRGTQHRHRRAPCAPSAASQGALHPEPKPPPQAPGQVRELRSFV